MDFFPVLENRRVLLRPLQEEDLLILLPVALQPALWEVGLTQIQQQSDLEKYIHKALEERVRQVTIPFVVLDKRKGRVAGSTRYMDISRQHRRAEIGSTWIDPELHGSGLNKAMKLAMLEHAFEVMELNRVELKTDVLNTRSRNAILSIGAREEGIFRRHMITSTGRVRDTIYFSIIREEWPEVKERIFAKYNF